MEGLERDIKKDTGLTTLTRHGIQNDRTQKREVERR